MPKHNRFADTVQFVRQLRAGGLPIRGADIVADLLDGYAGSIPPAVDQAMSQGTVGTSQTRKHRRAMVLILCILNNTAVRDAKAAVALIHDANLPAALAQAIEDVCTVYGGRVFRPIGQHLMANPAAFLASNRVKLGRARMTTSGPATYALSYDAHRRFYKLEPWDAMSVYVHGKIAGYNVHVQGYASVKDSLHDIAGSAVQGDLAVTTQLSGCTIVYRVNGPNLTVAHVMPDASVKRFVPQDLARYAGSPLGVVQTMRIVRDGNLAGGGQLGVYGMVDGPADTGLRSLGARRVRTHGYTDQLGNAYFIGVKVGGNWELFGQQNNPNDPNGGVSNLIRLYP